MTDIKILKKFLAVLLSVVMLMGLTVTSSAATKAQTKRVVSIVFDNSGSMYAGGENAWCRALYAMEVFAAMANSGDEIRIYPMWPVTVNGTEYTSSNPLVVKGGGDVSDIRNVYTENARSTPITTITSAYSDLQNQKADERWLVVLTDGDVFYEKEGGSAWSASETKNQLSTMLSDYAQHTNVMYLGIGSSACEPEISGGSKYQHYEAKAADSADILTDLTEMCNLIYGRDILPVSGSNVSFDLAMNKLILFVQGDGISDVKLVSSSGGTGTQTATYSPHYSDAYCGNTGADYAKKGIDTTLSGMLVTYEDVPRGSYTLQYSGNATSVSAYYEPNVNISAFLMTEDGVPITDLETAYPGTYTLNYGLVDENGDLTDSSLLGKRNFNIEYSINGEEHTASATENGSVPITINEGDEVVANVEATYLSGYYVTSNDNPNIDWHFPFTVSPRPVYDLTGEIEGGEKEYALSELEDKAVYTVTLSYDNEQITGDDLDRASLEVTFKDEPAPDYTVEKSSDGKSLLLTLKYPGGDASKLEAKKYVMSVNASYENEYGKTVEAPLDGKSFTIKDSDYKFKAKLSGPTYFVASKLDEADPISVELTHDGEPLTEEQLRAAALQVTVDGVSYTVDSEPDVKNSALLIHLNQDGTETGKHKITVTATSTDDVGRTVTAEDSETIEVSGYPLWLRILFILLPILLLLLLIWLFMNQKVLPKRISVERSNFVVDGTEVTGHPNVSYSGGGKKNGSLTIQSPRSPTNALASVGVSLELVATDPRRVRSRARAAIVKAVRPLHAGNITDLGVGSAHFSKDEDNKLVRNGGGKTDPKMGYNIRLSNRGHITISGAVDDGTAAGGGDISFEVTLKYL